MARALIVGCGCRGSELGQALLAAGWRVRGSSRDPDRLRSIAAAGIEPAAADPARIGSLLEQVADVAAVLWLMGSAHGPEMEELHGGRLRRLLERLVDTPVRAFLYEAAGTVDAELLAEGEAIVADADRRYRIPAAIIREDPRREREAWRRSALTGLGRLTGEGGRTGEAG